MNAPRKKIGRPRQGDDVLTSASIRLTAAQRAKLWAIGGAAWVRAQLAKVEHPKK